MGNFDCTVRTLKDGLDWICIFVQSYQLMYTYVHGLMLFLLIILEECASSIAFGQPCRQRSIIAHEVNPNV